MKKRRLKKEVKIALFIITLIIGAVFITKALNRVERIGHMCDIEKGHTSYTGNRGLPELREEICKYMERYGCFYNPETEILVTVGASEGVDASLRAILNPGDEILVCQPCYVNYEPLARLCNVNVIPIDTSVNGYYPTAEQIEKAITPKTKAIVPVHLFGQNANMEALLQLAKENNLYIVEDACQSIGADYTFADGSKAKSGCIGNIGCTSFFPSKNLGCYGDGGAIFTNDDELAAKMRAIANHGMVVRYYHDMIGVNSRLDSIQAAVLDVKLRHLDEYIAARQAAAAYYNNAFASCDKLVTPIKSDFTTHVFHQYTLKLQGVDRNGLQEYLKEKGIPAMIYYPVPLHLQKAYQDPRYKKGDFPVAEKLMECVLSLPMHTELDEEQLEYITTSVLEFVNK